MVTGYAYFVNKEYAYDDDDTARSDFDIRGVFVASILWPILLLGGLILSILKASMFGIFLLLFTVAVVVVRKPFLWRWIEPIILAIGRYLLKFSTSLIRLFTRQR